MKPMSRDPKILYFISDTVPTQRERLDARNYGFKVYFRNAKYVNEFSKVEDCDGVAGCVPACYAEKFEHASDVCAKYQAEFEAMQKEAEKELSSMENMSVVETEEDEVEVLASDEKVKTASKKPKTKVIDKPADKVESNVKGAFGNIGSWGVNKTGK